MRSRKNLDPDSGSTKQIQKNKRFLVYIPQEKLVSFFSSAFSLRFTFFLKKSEN